MQHLPQVDQWGIRHNCGTSGMNREDAIAGNAGILQRYLPKGAEPIIARWIVDLKVGFRITRPRETKLADFRAGGHGRPHVITINCDLNPYAFLTTTIHEFAHLGCFLKHGNSVAPHGPEWKGIYTEMLATFLGTGMYPPDVESALRKHIANPKASSCSCPELSRALAKYDQKPGLLLHDFNLHAPFEFNGVVYTAEEKRRTRYLCRRIADGRKFLISGRARVQPVRDA